MKLWKAKLSPSYHHIFNGCNLKIRKVEGKKAEEPLTQIINPLHPKISVHILHAVFYTFPTVLTWRFAKQSRALVFVDHYLILMTLMFDSGVIL